MKQDEKTDKETLKAWHDDPGNWKLGVFYFNKRIKEFSHPKELIWDGLLISQILFQSWHWL